MYFTILEFLKEEKIEDDTRWFSKKEIETAMRKMYESDFSETCLMRNLRRLRKWDKVFSRAAPKTSACNSTFRGKGMYLYKSKEDIFQKEEFNEIAYHRADAVQDSERTGEA